MAEENLQMYPINEDTGEIDTTTKLFPITKESNIIDDAGNVVQFQHKLNFANGLKNTNGTIELVMSVILNAVFPVGSIYCSTSNKTPSQLGFPGTWEQIKGKFLAAAGTETDAEGKSVTFTLGQTGGYSTAHLVTHNHSISNTTVTVNNKDPMKFDIDCRRLEENQKVVELRNASGCTVTENEYSPEVASIDYSGRHWMGRWTVDLKHGHTTNAHTHTLGEAGNINVTNAYNIPPYLAVNMWKRTS